MLKVRTYIFIAIVVYLAVLISGLPASLLVSRLEQSFPQTIKANKVSGTIWVGSMQGQISQQNITLDWDLNVLRLFLLELSADINLKAELVDLESNVGISFNRAYINDAKATINGPVFNKLLKQFQTGVDIQGDIFIKNFDLTRADAQFTHAEGKAQWEGGIIEVDNLPQGSIDAPALEATFSENDEGISVDLKPRDSKTNASLSLLVIDLSHNGRAHLKVKEAIADFVNIPKQLKQGSPDAVIFEIKREVFTTNGEF